MISIEQIIMIIARINLSLFVLSRLVKWCIRNIKASNKVNISDNEIIDSTLFVAAYTVIHDQIKNSDIYNTGILFIEFLIFLSKSFLRSKIIKRIFIKFKKFKYNNCVSTLSAAPKYGTAPTIR